MEALIFWIGVVFAVVTLAFSAQAIVWSACTAWYLEGSRVLRRQGLRAYDRRRADPPWYIRYSEWLERRTSRKKEAR